MKPILITLIWIGVLSAIYLECKAQRVDTQSNAFRFVDRADNPALIRLRYTAQNIVVRINDTTHYTIYYTGYIDSIFIPGLGMQKVSREFQDKVKPKCNNHGDLYKKEYIRGSYLVGCSANDITEVQNDSVFVVSDRCYIYRCAYCLEKLHSPSGIKRLIYIIKQNSK